MPHKSPVVLTHQAAGRCDEAMRVNVWGAEVAIAPHRWRATNGGRSDPRRGRLSD
ncbi:hypothetical protein IFJ82_03450 [Novacetimonas hansenii]|uniref:hypothetical protein n=1 Tax=Novacetimonas hansenii TaxID=436 RepID=UPI0012DA8226|nr:hypothetical protein [Novacetimonas hansenii]QOF95723.1 hypothetical protein IFJ82_03450 [Novacetimonas hansenii]WEQ58622.1 hypothetical protein LV563_12375 [Novacetimonas hansenii]